MTYRSKSELLPEMSASSNGSASQNGSGEAHQPRKDADISGSSSLFDL